MKDNIDVFQQQVQRDRSRNRVPPVDYKEHDDTFHVIQYIFECGEWQNFNSHTKLLTGEVRIKWSFLTLNQKT